jgi:hypothetical protein
MSDGPPEWFDRLHGGGRGRGVRRDDEPAKMVEIAGEVKGVSKTGNAVHFYDGTKTVWLPRSQIEETETGLLVAEWLAKKNGLI